MKIIITGGTGLIGCALSSFLNEEGHQVTVLTRNPAKAKTVLPPGVQAVEWDAHSSKGWGDLMEETDAVVNLAGESIAGNSLSAILTRRWTEERKNRIKNSRIKVGQALVKALRNQKRKPDVFIQASAVGYYGPRGEESITENASPGKNYLAQVCQAWESSTAEVEEMGVRRVIIRTGLVLSAQGGILPVMLLPFRFFVGGPLGKGNQFVPWIHIQDEIKTISFLLKNQTTQGVYNLSSPNPVTNAELGRIAGHVLDRPFWLPVPAFALRIALGEKASLVLDGQRTIPLRLQEAGYNFIFEKLKPALKDLT